MFFIFTPGKMIQFDLRIFFRWVGTRLAPPSHQFVGDPSWMARWMTAKLQGMCPDVNLAPGPGDPGKPRKAVMLPHSAIGHFLDG